MALAGGPEPSDGLVASDIAPTARRPNMIWTPLAQLASQHHAYSSALNRAGVEGRRGRFCGRPDNRAQDALRFLLSRTSMNLRVLASGSQPRDRAVDRQRVEVRLIRVELGWRPGGSEPPHPLVRGAEIERINP